MLLSFHCFLLLIFIRLDTAMKSKTFDSIVTFLRDSNITKFEALQQRFPDLDVNSLRSIFCQQIERRSISFNCAAIEKPETHWEWFTKMKDGDVDDCAAGFVERRANALGMMPITLIRCLLHSFLQLADLCLSMATSLIRDPSQIDDIVLRREVLHCILSDEVFGPYTTSIRNKVGEEHEVMLQEALGALQIPFETENQLRVVGCDKTPDIKLVLPVELEGQFVINWIESKAMFADKRIYSIHVREQLQSYVNRFGPGLVIYWMDFVDDLAVDDGIFIRNHIPQLERFAHSIRNTNK